MSGSGSVNKVILVGRLGKDPAIRYTTDGTPVANFSVATDETFTDRAGDKQSNTQWHRVVVWKKLAEICGDHLHKGRQVYIEGSLRSRKWQDRQGNERISFEVVATRMVMLGSKPGTQQGSNGSGGNSHVAGQPTTEPDIGAEDIPF
ncbi:MAG TPA: single-stranded DNA-binding protein [Terriglobia bacterium]|jgi:single-strand DNA-binding protein|nr:single-stranded DNA-binding protein [Terriglobia bacterium]